MKPLERWEFDLETLFLACFFLNMALLQFFLMIKLEEDDTSLVASALGIWLEEVDTSQPCYLSRLEDNTRLSLFDNPDNLGFQRHQFPLLSGANSTPDANSISKVKLFMEGGMEELAKVPIGEQRLDRYNSLEEKISEFLNNGYADSDATDDYGSDDNESIDALQHDLYWESQEALLQEILERYALVGAKLRQEINGIIEEARETVFCSCKNQKQTQKQSPRTEAGCINCLRMRVIHLLCRRGLNATLCVSKWKHIKNHRAAHGPKKQIPFVIEPEFRDEFEIAKACDEYMKLVDKLPECYVGKSEYLNPIVGVMCDSAKRSMEEQKLHMGPWRKRSFVQMKWSNSS
ncbi:LRR protein [Hibiscus syriacus]|uniref:LRR protein n=1 Tax=Hibiscus syriacus TaxID=106335 RepID=A0A6A2YPK3_HIBSY|nr:LRR protein [Hibiscus syriacus]